MVKHTQSANSSSEPARLQDLLGRAVALGIALAAISFVCSACGQHYPALVTAGPDRVVVAYEPTDGIPKTSHVALHACREYGAVPEYVSSDDKVVIFKCLHVDKPNTWDSNTRPH